MGGARTHDRWIMSLPVRRPGGSVRVLTWAAVPPRTGVYGHELQPRLQPRPRRPDPCSGATFIAP
jgi:hypothetical protein